MIAQFLEAAVFLNLADESQCKKATVCQSFYFATQHDHLDFDWDGVRRKRGMGYLESRLEPMGFVPINSQATTAAKRPDAPVPLARQVTSRFTNMLTGEGRRAHLRCHTCSDTQEFLDAAFKSAELWDVLSQARDVAGAAGCSAIALGVKGGYFEAEVLNPSNLKVLEWNKDAPGWVPNAVVEQRLVEKEVRDDPNDRTCVRVAQFYRTRMWTPLEIVIYEDIEVGKESDDETAPILEIIPHKFGACPVVWYQNTRDTESPAGTPDCEGAWMSLDKLDRLQSQVYKSAIANTSPTMLVKSSMRSRKNKNNMVNKGGVLAVDTDGDARYIETNGGSVETGMKAIDKLVYQVLQTVECVVIHPDTARAYQSGEALQILWRSMESRANRLRVTLGGVIRSLAKLLLSAAQNYGVANVEEDGDKDAAPGLLLPPRRLVTEEEPEEDELAEEGAPAKPGGVEVEFVTHSPGGPYVYVDLEWPPYWTPTAAQIGAMAQAMSVATTQKQVLSTETASRSLSQMMGQDGDDEMRRIAEEKRAGMAMMLDGMGGFGDLEDLEKDEAKDEARDIAREDTGGIEEEEGE